MTSALAPPNTPVRRWSILAAATLAQASSAVMVNGTAFLIPAFHTQAGLGLPEAGTVTAAPTFGVMLTLVLWGWVADHLGERIVLLAGLGGTALCAAAATFTHGPVTLAVLLAAGGAFAASTNAASGRVVVGWFPPHRRGLAMGIRQMAQPAGVGIAAVTMAVVAEHLGPYDTLWIPSGACALAAVAVAAVLADPPRPDRRTTPAPNPYAADGFLARIHGVSVLLVVPQFVVWTFVLVWLVDDRGWTAGAAGVLVAVAQIFGALGRIGAGQLSDTVASRVRPLRWVAWAAGGTMLLLGITAGLGWFVAVPLVVIATVLTVADNGLSFTAVAERAGPFWSGRALGVQNTAQFLTSSLVPPLGGLAITHLGYSWTFAMAAFFPLLATGFVPRRDPSTP